MMTTQCQTVIFGHSIHRVSFAVTCVGVHEVITTLRQRVGLAGNHLCRGTDFMLSRLRLYFQQLIDQEQIGKQRAKMN
jgi:hypothetical protein